MKRIDTMETISCPCCGDSMDINNVVCWNCYNFSCRLTPGTYTTYDVIETGDTWTITQDNTDKWDDERVARVGYDVRFNPHPSQLDRM